MTFLTTLLVGGGLIVGTVVPVSSLIGILVAIPLALVVSIVWALGAAIGCLAIADRLVGREDG